MDIVSSLAVVAFAALIHASFQLSVSVLSLLSGHAIGAKHSHAKLLRLISGFLFGASVMTLLLLSFTCLVAFTLLGVTIPAVAWAASCGLLIGIGIAVWLFYYRRDRGTTLWVPRSLAGYLSDRTKKTRRSAEAFGLGLSSVIAEILFIAAPLIVAALVIVELPAPWQLTSLALYVVISLFPLLVISGLVGSGHKLSNIQRWREKNKYFLQFSAGSGLIILAFYVYVNEIMATAAAMGAL